MRTNRRKARRFHGLLRALSITSAVMAVNGTSAADDTEIDCTGMCGDVDQVDCLTVTRRGPCEVNWVRAFPEVGEISGQQALPGTPMTLICCSAGSESCGPTEASWTTSYSSTASIAISGSVKVRVGAAGTGSEFVLQTTQGFSYTYSDSQTFGVQASTPEGTVRLVEAMLYRRPVRAVIEVGLGRHMTIWNACMDPPRLTNVSCGVSVHRAVGPWQDSFHMERRDNVWPCEDCLDPNTGGIRPECLAEMEPF